MNRIAIALLALAFALPASAELYRWTDDKGRVHYSDQPPPPSVRKHKRIHVPGESAAEPTQSRPPVLLYTGTCGATCEQAADYLRQRGVPFSLKNATQDPAAAAELKRRTGALEVPILFIGESMQRGYSPSVWDKMLEVAGYPGPSTKPVQSEEETPAEPGGN